MCSCGERKTEISKALGHTFSEWENTSASTCKTNGKDRQICSVCSTENFRMIDKLVHDYSVAEEEIDGVIHNTYSCLNCSDSFSVSNEIEVEFESYEPQQLFDRNSSFSFDVICSEDESYIRENLVIVDAYFEGSENENSTFAICEYNVENIEDGLWRVTPVSSYTAGNTYMAKRSNGVIFKEYGISDLTFSIFKEETNVMDFNDDIIFLQELENKNPGYYPYTIDYSENSGLYWVTLGKVDGLKAGNIVCVGNATSTEEMFDNYNGDNTFGKIEAISYSPAEKIYQVAMSVPSFEEIFDELDVHSTKLQQAGKIEVIDSDEIVTQLTTTLYNSEDFIRFMGATYVTANEFLENRGAKSVVGTFKDFLNSIKIDEKNIDFDSKTGTITAKIKIVGSVAIPVTVYGGGGEREVGNVVISFSAYVNLDYLKLETNFNQQEIDKAEEEKITKLKVGAVQSVTTGFTFNVAMNIDYSMQATPYVLNSSSRVYHFEGCKHVAAIKSENIVRITTENLWKMISEGSLSEEDECGTCRPVSAMKSDNFVLNTSSKVIHLHNCKHLSNVSASELLVSSAPYGNLELSGYTGCESCKPYSRHLNSFSESLLNKMQSQDFGDNLEEINKAAEGVDDSEKSKRILVAEVPFIIGVFSVDFEIYAYIDFTLKASLTYEYEQTSVTRYGFEIKSLKISPYYGKEEFQNKNIITATGETLLEVGALGVVKASFIGLEKVLYASFNAECGAYALLNGALQQDFINSSNSYMAAYFECGLACDVYGEIKIPFFSVFVFPFFDGRYPILKLGYDMVVYKFNNVPDSIVIDSNKFCLIREDLLSVTAFNLKTMKEEIGYIFPNRFSNRFTVNYSLKHGDNCYIEGDYLYVIDNSKSFTDELTVTVIGYDKWDDYKASNIKFDLEPYSVVLTYEPIESYTREGDTIYFGSYPQTEVKDTNLITILNNKAGILPTSSNSQAWTSYDYYINGAVENYMWYIDIEYNGEKYRGVYFTSNRPSDVNRSANYSEQDNNGYLISTDEETNIYWFEYEPISWTILKKNETDNIAFICCDIILDAQAYHNDFQEDDYDFVSTTEGVPKGTIANNYQYSTIRCWLNNIFYNTAFDEFERNAIIVSTIDNSSVSIEKNQTFMDYETTQDKIFLLSYDEVTNNFYDMNLNVESAKKGTDYALSQGLSIFKNQGEYDGNGIWWLRSPGHNMPYSIAVSRAGKISGYFTCGGTSIGVVPALQIKL